MSLKALFDQSLFLIETSVYLLPIKGSAESWSTKLSTRGCHLSVQGHVTSTLSFTCIGLRQTRLYSPPSSFKSLCCPIINYLITSFEGSPACTPTTQPAWGLWMMRLLVTLFLCVFLSLDSRCILVLITNGGNDHYIYYFKNDVNWSMFQNWRYSG